MTGWRRALPAFLAASLGGCASFAPDAPLVLDAAMPVCTPPRGAGQARLRVDLGTALSGDDAATARSLFAERAGRFNAVTAAITRDPDTELVARRRLTEEATAYIGALSARLGDVVAYQTTIDITRDPAKPCP